MRGLLRRKIPALMALLMLAGAAASAPRLLGQESPKTKLMSVKRGYAHALLDAVIEEDFTVVREQAFRLKVIAETADWRDTDGDDYRRAETVFVDALDTLGRAAGERDSDAVVEACHPELHSLSPPHRTVG